MHLSTYTVVGYAATAYAATRGFVYVPQDLTQAAFETEFESAAGLEGLDGFDSARLYSMIQYGTTNTITPAIPAAIASNTTLLLGISGTSDQTAFDNEIAVLQSALTQYGQSFADLVVGISVDGANLYRGVQAGMTIEDGTPDDLVDYLQQIRTSISGTLLSGKPVGHVNQVEAFTNASYSDVISNSDFLGLDDFPYFLKNNSNSIDNAPSLFFDFYDAVVDVAGDAEVWVTETGWPYYGPVINEATPGDAEAGQYWQQVACELESRGVNFWWYSYFDNYAEPSLGVVRSSGGAPIYDLSCSSTTTS